MINNEETMPNALFVNDEQRTVVNNDGSITIIAIIMPYDEVPEQVQCGLQVVEENEAAR